MSKFKEGDVIISRFYNPPVVGTVVRDTDLAELVVQLDPSCSANIQEEIWELHNVSK